MTWTGELLALLIVAALLLAAATDIACRVIPDSLAALVATLGLAARLLHGPAAPVISVAVALALFAVLVLLHGRGLLGGGDVKLATAICCGLSPTAVHQFVIVTAMAGGILATLHLAGRRAFRHLPLRPPPRRGASLPWRVFCAERWRMARRGSLPYGVAIACGGTWAVLDGLRG